jgi:hypothetical protein
MHLRPFPCRGKIILEAVGGPMNEAKQKTVFGMTR